ncbi:copper chaperone PCu(A)C [Caldilinea sp.]|uniref:copper chaperone PCu(A)C n=1 Tax=Caldilinea sp. TaxID=2293560 RepID=UPI002B5144A4|nr:copper chaperone PCu(A)C [Anaerolineales bacterium]HQY92208.1 copper chaperone PCu(A)C [Caldilinea sp.]HRA68570.1 copper chaperone PCu(A)C [Caldilinea sp.]
MMRKQLLTLLLVFLVAGLAGCTVAPMQPAGSTTGMSEMAGADAMATEAPLPEPEPGKLTIVDVRARPAPLVGGTGAVYFTVLNGLDTAVQLVSAASPAANVVETHETIAENGVMKMIPQLDGYPIPAGEALVLKPGGKHIMLIDIVKSLEPGDEVNLTVNFDNGDSMELTVPVLDMQMNMPMNMEKPAAAGDMAEHGDMAPSDLMLSPETKAAINGLPLDDVYSINEALNAGGTLDPAVALTTLDALMEQVNGVSWPVELEESIGTMKMKAEMLRGAIEGDDMAAAGPLAAELHDLLHEIEMHATE